MTLLARLIVTYLLLAVSVKGRTGHNSVKGSDFNNGPEDLLLEEMVRRLKWIQQAREVQADELDSIQQQFRSHNGPSHPSSDVAQHNFAYRPHDAGFKHSAPKHQFNPIVEESFGVVNKDIRRFGQKEDADLFDDGPRPLQPQRSDAADVAVQLETEPDGALVKFAQSKMQDVPVRTNPRDPVAHAILSSDDFHQRSSLADIYLTALVAGCTASAVAAILALGVWFYRWQGRVKSAQDVEYPAYGITGPGPTPSSKGSLKTSPSSGWIKSPKSAVSGDKKLAHSAHMFHFQHQKQQVIAMENHSGCDRRGSNSGGESDEDNEEGDYTVYECPGLAPTGEMEVKNPLFLDDPTPASPALKRPSE